MNKFVCIHGHFYQPPRENAWLEVIEQQDSAFPFHDWNERITHECYAPNGASRILDDNDRIINIVNNYARISFNFGPTLLHWMERNAPEAYADVIAADKESLLQFNGHGSAMAQVFNHIILPLANRRDKETQVKWGIEDFKLRFNRLPEGMWLAETAVDTESLEVLAENGITFTILAPRQAKRIKKINENAWQDIVNEQFSTKRPYVCKLPSGKTITLFFYDGGLSQDIAFKGILIDGKDFAKRLTSAFSNNEELELVHVATDGESYGHHHKHGDMALAYCLDYIEKQNLARITNYAEFLSLTSPEWEAEIHENSSWSCAHGVERWRNDCSCSSGMNPGWNQQWRKPLREALDWLRDQLATVFEKELSRYCESPWDARNAYIQVILNRNQDNVTRFLQNFCGKIPEGDHKTKVLRLFEMQRNCLLMFTSCGWFFDEISGIETTQILQYADRAIQLAESESSIVLHKAFLQLLSKAPSNIAAYGNGALVHKEFVQPSRLSLSKVGQHYAVASLFDDFPEQIVICNYRAESVDYQRVEAGAFRLAIGHTQVYSLITDSVKQFYFAVLWLGQNHIIGNAQNFMEVRAYNEMKAELLKSFENSSIAEVIGNMQRYFTAEKFSMWNLFKDEQRKVLSQILEKDVRQAEDSNRSIYNGSYNILTVLSEAGLPIPAVLRNNLETVINTDIRHFFENGQMFIPRLEKLAEDALKWKVELDKTTIAFAAGRKLFEVLKDLDADDQGERTLDILLRIMAVLQNLEIELELFELQNQYFKLGKLIFLTSGLSFKDPAMQSDWVAKFVLLGNHLKVKLNIENSKPSQFVIS